MNFWFRAQLYDLFKLIVALILLLIFLFLLLWMPPSGARQPAPIMATLPSQPSVPTDSPTATFIPPTETFALTITASPVPAETQLPTLTPTIVPSPTESPVPEITSTPAPAAETGEDTNGCESVTLSQLQAGMQATIVRYLNFRSSPGFLDNWILTNAPGTQVEILGGPECTRYEGGGLYLWWQIRLPDGQIGWSAEASASGAFYFMEPAP
jgi:hypothetical protein